MNTKICSKCGIEQTLECFRRDITKKDGLRSDCKKCIKDFELKKRQNNPEMMREKLQTFYQKNPEKRKEYRQNYKPRKQEQRKERRKVDPIFNITNRMRCRIWKFLKLLKVSKKNKTFEIVGCCPNFLKEFIESKFVEGMTWDNRNEWHIDHIIPLSTAKTEDELYNLCHYTNLQPLWSEDNIKKSNKIYSHLNLSCE